MRQVPWGSVLVLVCVILAVLFVLQKLGWIA